MIPHFRAALFVFGLLFVYFFGETLEKFILEVVRFFITMDSSNALLFNLIHLLTLIFPLLLYGIVVSISLSGEKDLQTRFFLLIGGMILGIICYRIYQVWWVFRGVEALDDAAPLLNFSSPEGTTSLRNGTVPDGTSAASLPEGAAMGEELISWTESLTVRQLYFLEKIFPYTLLGIFSSLVVAIGEKELDKVNLFSLLTASCSFLWLLITHKIQNLSGTVQILTALAVSSLCGLLAGFTIKELKVLKSKVIDKKR